MWSVLQDISTKITTTALENKKKQRGIEEIGNYVHIYNGVSKDCQAIKRISITANKKVKCYIRKWEEINEDVIWIDL